MAEVDVLTSVGPDIGFRRAAGACGAYVTGVDLSRTLSDEAIAKIRYALHDHGVLVFRDQEITPEEQVAFASRFGKLHVHPFVPNYPGHPEIMLIKRQKDVKVKNPIRWHADSTWEEKPPLASLLKAVTLPELGGDTTWSSMYAAYDGLSDAMKQFLNGLHAVHDAAVQGRLEHFNADNAQKPLQSAVHPVVITDPVTKKKALFVNPGYTTHIAELSAEESASLLSFLFTHQTRPEYCFRLQWEPGTIAFWCNLVTQHLAIPDYNADRLMHRVAILCDDAPVR